MRMPSLAEAAAWRRNEKLTVLLKECDELTRGFGGWYRGPEATAVYLEIVDLRHRIDVSRGSDPTVAEAVRIASLTHFSLG